MNLRWLTLTFAAMAVATSAFGQITNDQKDQVLGEVDHVLSEKAFVPGVDLTKWRSFLDERKDKLDKADMPGQFASVVNAAFKEFGLSHMVLIPGRMRRYWGFGGVSAQGTFGPRGRKPELSWIESDAAVIRVPSFERGYDRNDVAELLKSAKDAKYLIVDLRDDPGGEVDNMRQFLGLLLPEDSSIGTFVSRKMATDFQDDHGKGTDPVAIAKWAHDELHPLDSGVAPFAGKVAVLVDGHSASAAEIVADALRDDRHSPVVGQPTMGAVLVSVIDRLSYGFRIQFPIGDYVTHDGIRLEGHPIKPDVAADGDHAVDAALAKLKSG